MITFIDFLFLLFSVTYLAHTSILCYWYTLLPLTVVYSVKRMKKTFLYSTYVRYVRWINFVFKAGARGLNARSKHSDVYVYNKKRKKNTSRQILSTTFLPVRIANSNLHCARVTKVFADLFRYRKIIRVINRSRTSAICGHARYIIITCDLFELKLQFIIVSTRMHIKCFCYAALLSSWEALFAVILVLLQYARDLFRLTHVIRDQNIFIYLSKFIVI